MRRASAVALLAGSALALYGSAVADRAPVDSRQQGPGPQAAEKNWPGFRGPQSSGVVDGPALAANFDVTTGANVLWSTEVPGLGHSSPIVWADTVYLTTAIHEGAEPLSSLQRPERPGDHGTTVDPADDGNLRFLLYALDRNYGRVVWEREVIAGRPADGRHPKASYANATPASDGERVVAMFGAEGLFAWDNEGNPLWSVDLGSGSTGWFFDPSVSWGAAASPVIWGDRVFVQVDVHGDSFIAAYALEDGAELWRTPRDEPPSWSTPTVVETARPFVVANGGHAIRAYDAEDGREVWRLAPSSTIAVPTPIAAFDFIFVTSGYLPIQPLYAIRTSAAGDLTTAEDTGGPGHVAWASDRGGAYVPTPIVVGDYLYVLDSGGDLTCFDARSGVRVYQQRVSAAGFTASPVAANGRIYLASEDGEVFVIEAGVFYEQVSVNRVTEPVLATPAIADGILFIRGRRRLFAIAAQSSRIEPIGSSRVARRAGR